MTRLGVNIDHVATLRQARGEPYPSIVSAARECLQAGADQITIHLREDRRHIQDPDASAVKLVCAEFGRPLNFEMGCNEDILNVALATQPEWICLVPEKREEKTTEGGLDLHNEQNLKKVREYCNTLKEKLPNVKISLFLEANIETLEKACALPIDAVEIHTGDYARAFLQNEVYTSYLEQFAQAKAFLGEHNIGCHAGHGLTLESYQKLVDEDLFVEYNIGHWIICESIFKGLHAVVKEMKEVIS